MIDDTPRISLSEISDGHPAHNTTTHFHFTFSFVGLGFVMVGSGTVGNCLILVNTVMLGANRTLYDVLFMNVSLADLMITGCWLPLFVLDVSGSLHISDRSCDVVSFVVLVVWPGSVISFTLLSFIRYLHVCHNYHRLFWRRRALQLCVLIWALCFLMAFPTILLHEEHEHDSPYLFQCTVGSLQGLLYPRPYIIFIAIVPLHVVVFCNIAIYRRWLQAQRSIRNYEPPLHAAGSNVVIAPPRRNSRLLFDPAKTTSFVVLTPSKGRPRAGEAQTVTKEVLRPDEGTGKPGVRMNDGFTERRTADNQNDPNEKYNVVYIDVLKRTNGSCGSPVDTSSEDFSHTHSQMSFSVEASTCSLVAQSNDPGTDVDDLENKKSQLPPPDQPTDHTESETSSDIDKIPHDNIAKQPPSPLPDRPLRAKERWSRVVFRVVNEKRRKSPASTFFLAASILNSTFGRSQKWISGFASRPAYMKTVRQLKQEMTLLQGMLVVVTTSVLSVLPYGIITVVDAIRPVSRELLVTSSLLRFSCNAFNWVVYVFMIPTVQKRYVAFYHRLVKCVRCSRAAPT